MAITEQQLEDWAKAPTSTNQKSANTYNKIKEILENEFWNKVEVFLQGSYANSTNIQEDSDIDIDIRYNDVYFSNLDQLSEIEKNIYHQNRIPATYEFSQFKTDVFNLLQKHFGNNVERKDKCIRVIKSNADYLDADVVPCFVHRRYKSYNIHNNTFDEGIEFWTDKWEQIVWFPKQHKDNGEQKNKQTKTVYKDIVRIMKNCKKYLIDHWTSEKEMVSSFMIECLIWNIENSYFDKSTYKEITHDIVVKLYWDMEDETKYPEYIEVCKLFYLLRWTRNKHTPQEIQTFLLHLYSLTKNK